MPLIEKFNYFYRRFPLAEKLTSSWITGEWLPSLGLPQFGPVFEAQLVDGRILDHLTAKELEKNFTMISKTHVSSILAGIELLRLFDFDKKVCFKLLSILLFALFH